ncbi:MAG: hypothetical protein K6B75_07065 [Lachnospiraceae bacterium]|nr:hypothetical protein [Lachnospiraceae bacterium]
MSGKDKATVSMVLGVLGLILAVTGLGFVISVILGIIGLCYASMAKKDGYTGNERTMGFIFSLLALILGVIVTLVFIGVVAFFIDGVVNGNPYFYKIFPPYLNRWK